MIWHISRLLQILNRKEFPIYVVFLIAAMSLTGWLSGKMGLASYSLEYIPIAPVNVLILIIISITFLIKRKSVNSGFVSSVTTLIVIIVGLFCLFILVNYKYGFSWDPENLVVRNPDRFGNVVTGRISPISSLLYIFICVGILSINEKNSLRVRYIGGCFSLLVFVISSVLLIGYLFKAPLLYGSNIIPVSLPAAICFFLFSDTLLRVYGFRIWTFNLIRNNKVRYLLLKSFLPVVVFIIILQGFLDSHWSFNDKNPPLTGAFILLIVTVVTTIMVYRLSTKIGAQLLNAEKQLKESEEKFRSIMEHSADAIFITNQEGKYIYTNKAASDMLGYSPEELKSKTIADMSPPEKMAEYFEVFKQILSGNDKVLTEIVLIKSNGTFILTELSAVLLPDGTVYGSCRDITERKFAENKVKDLNKKLFELNMDKDRFMAILGHDLKSPFNNLLGLSGVLLDDLTKLSREEINDLALNINITAKKTYTLLEDILIWARTQQGKIPFKPQKLRLCDICNQILEILRKTAEKKKISIDYVGQEDLVVFADPDMLKAILRNLFTNAIKFTNSNGTVRASAVEDDGKVLITVSDNGIGIDPENISKLFDISQVLSTPGTDGESGTGLGLLLCKDFVEKHGGRIWVESEPGKGSKFRFTI